ncbi:MAG: hypothetical protein AAGA48_23355 [Myxococcota bacterium]
MPVLAIVSVFAYAGLPPVDLDQALAACSVDPVHPLPILSADQKQALRDGEVVRILNQHKDQPSTAVGLALLKAPREALWVACQDPHAQVDPSLTEFIVESRGPDRKLWYGYFDLPRPLQDRQWVVESNNNHRMAQKTGQRCWEHTWVLEEDGLERVRSTVERDQPRGITLDHLDRAIFTPTNRGSWTMADLGDGTVLTAYSASSTVGGLIPDWLVARLAKSRLESVLRSLEARANTWSLKHYRAGHEPLAAGDGTPIAPFTN